MYFIVRNICISLLRSD